MLVLTRNPGESLMIDDDIEVIVIGVKGNQVRLAITAPPDIKIWRKEIYLKIKAERAKESG